MREWNSTEYFFLLVTEIKMSIRTNNWDVKNTKLEIHVQSFRTKKIYIILFGRKFEIPSKVIVGRFCK